MNELLTTQEMADADARAVALGVPSLTLMENAGRAVAGEAAKMVAPGGKIAVLCGPGNNGGDGFVAARLLRERGFDVRVACLVPVEELRGDAAEMAKRWDGALAAFEPGSIKNATVVIDAIFGAGLNRPVPREAGQIIAHARRAGTIVLAVDVPSGLDGNTGAIQGTVFEAQRTVTFFRKKPGHLLLPGRTFCGDLVVEDIAIPEAVLTGTEKTRAATWQNDPSLWLERFPTLGPEAHKYQRGHAVLVSGPAFQTGACRMAARGALRIGAGLVTVASPPSALPENAAHLTAIMLNPVVDAPALAKLLADTRFTAVCIGPGAGARAETRDLVYSVLASGRASVLDADALNAFAAGSEQGSASPVGFGFTAKQKLPLPAPDDLFAAIAKRGDAVVMTPHHGEFARLFPDLVGIASKLESARAAAKRSGAILVYKGADTVIADPDGRAAINANAPPTLATAGSGDVLAGFITGLLAQGMPAFEAACAAVWLHGECANAFGPGLIAEDLPEMLPGVIAMLDGFARLEAHDIEGAQSWPTYNRSDQQSKTT